MRASEALAAADSCRLLNRVEGTLGSAFQPMATVVRHHRRLSAAAIIKPIEQGELDRLCGLYAIINAFRLASAYRRGLTLSESKRLFSCGITFIERHGRLSSCACVGMKAKFWRALARALAEELKAITGMAVEFARAGDLTLGQTFAFIEAALANGQPTMLLLGKTYHHYSVVVGLSHERLELFDSWGYSWVGRGSCGSKIDPGEARHVLGHLMAISVV